MKFSITFDFQVGFGMKYLSISITFIRHVRQFRTQQLNLNILDK